MSRPDEYEVRVLCLTLAHEAEESIAQTKKRAEAYLDFLSPSRAQSSSDGTDRIVPFKHAAKPL